MQESSWSSKCRIIKDSGSLPRDRTKQTRNEVIRSVLKEIKIMQGLGKDRYKKVEVFNKKPLTTYKHGVQN